MIPGAGWLSAGPGYRHWYKKDAIFVDTSASISWNGYKMAQARFELPKFAKSRLALGTQVRWQDYSHIGYFGEGPATLESARNEYGVNTAQAEAYATLRPVPWLALGGSLGWMNPEVRQQTGSPDLGLADERTFVPAEVSLTIDARDFPGHPTRGVLVRAAGARFEDRDGGAYTFQRYEGEAAAFVPIAGARVVLALHGWLVTTETEDGRSVPFYLLPSLGGVHSLRSYANYRFHDRNMVVGNAEVRLKLTTHMDLAMFADAGNVARERRDLDFAKRSYGAGIRLHTRRETYALLDVATGDEGWQVLFRLHDPLRLSRLTRRAMFTPVVP
jgi:outer membrane protein assembly factor BamA